MRRVPAFIIATGMVAALSACASSPLAGCDPIYPVGSNAEIVTAAGTLGVDPEATFPTPLIATTTQAAVVKTGEGAAVLPGDIARLHVSIYDGETGTKILATDAAGPGVLGSVVEGQPAFGAVAACTLAGSRVAATGPASEILGEEIIAQYQLPVAPDATVVLVTDVMQRFLGKADGAAQVAPSGLPAVATAPNGRTGVVFPDSAAPTDQRIAILRAGSGTTVKQGDSVVVHSTGIVWGGTSTFESTWDLNAPAVWLAESSENAEGGILPGLSEALIGAKVGSQVIVSIPAGEGYPVGAAPTGVTDADTLVFVVDILGIG